MHNLILFEAMATLVGTIIGAGILGIPYVFAQAGFWTGSLVLIVVGLAMIVMKLMYGEVTLRTRGNHQIVGYTGIYLGQAAKYVMSFILIAAIYGALLAYFIGEGQVIEAVTGIPSFWASIGFYAVFVIFVYAGLKLIKRTELIMSGIILAVIGGIALVGMEQIELANLSGLDWSKLAVPYGVLLFACSGIVAVPSVRLILKRKEKLMKRAIIWGCAIPPVIYFLFAALVISISGGGVSEVASVGLGEMLGWKMILVANIFAFFAMATSFLTLGLALMGTYEFDFKLAKKPAWVMLVVVPLIVFLLGVDDFVEVLGIVGALGVGVAGIVEVVTFWVARKRGARQPEYALPGWLGYIGGGFIVILFALGIVYTLGNLL